MDENYSLLFLPQLVEAITYKTDGRGPALNIPMRDRATHGERLINKFREIWQLSQANKNSRLAISQPVKEGTYIEFISAVGFDLVTKSLEDQRSKIRILNIREEIHENQKQTFATIFVPSGKENFFLKKIRKYLDEDNEQSGKPKNLDLVNSIEDIRIAVLESFWTDPEIFIPTNNTEKQCELWLKASPGKEAQILDNIRVACELFDVELFTNRIVYFPERVVVLIKANRLQLLELLESSPDIAELRAAKETALFWLSQPNVDQAAWTTDLLSRIKIVDSNVNVCVLDTGVNNGHPLISPVLRDNHCGSFDPSWGISDDDGHGTLMSGVVAYGSLEQALEHSGEIELSHTLSSVKILPPRGENNPDLYGAITQQAISIAEIQAPEKTQIFCCAVTSATIDHKGKPTSWSGAIDSITSGQVDGEKRLYIVSAGNVRNSIDWNGYPDINLIRSIEDPAQSWNALTVGAYTEKVQITDRQMAGHTALAPLRGLSPYSTCSLLWVDGKWPIKPEIVLEGGNIRRAPDGTLYENSPDLSILSTSNEIVNNQFDTIFTTSAATAKAAWIAAKIQAQYPQIWPETLKGLMVHSAEWPDTIIQQYQLDTNKKADILKLMRICGFGVPNIERALHCNKSVLTLVAEEQLQPFQFSTPQTPQDTKRPIANDMHLFELPWPKDLLLAMGAMQIKLKVTLCYFIEPAPGEIGWKDKYRYASHAFRFDVNNVNESKTDFVKRLNIASREEDEKIQTKSGSERWLIGSDNRSLGAITSDIWEGNAADIATCNMIGIYPVVGWWRERKHLGNVEKMARYSLIVSLVTPTQDVDIYTPIMNILRVPVEIPTPSSPSGIGRKRA